MVLARTFEIGFLRGCLYNSSTPFSRAANAKGFGPKAEGLGGRAMAAKAGKEEPMKDFRIRLLVDYRLAVAILVVIALVLLFKK